MNSQNSDKRMPETIAAAGESAREEPGGATRVVGIGASAGGLDALKEFFSEMPVDSGMAFVVVQHLEPTHESRMAEILARFTTMKVGQAEDGVPVEPNAVYTNPPGKLLRICDGRLDLGGQTTHAHVVTPIDHFLVSLAADLGPAAICIILSGSSGSDGPRGVRAVRAAGGMCMAQEPGSAQFAAMPQAVVDSGLADFVLTPAQMPVSLLSFAGRPHLPGAGRAESPEETAPGYLEAILKLLRLRTNSDYSCYKRTTVFRRVQRRMGIRQLNSMAEYIELLQKDAKELTQLARDMLIGVSSFFRDAGVFESLRREVVAPLLQAGSDDAPLRAWVAGCASGEEAYSIAMLLLEARSAAGRTCPVQVFATDVDDQALETARAGVYPLSIADEVPVQRLEAFFTKQGDTYQVEKHLRETVVFSRHNLLADPPFSKLDLISCRNVLIYIEPAAQKKVLSVFSFALKVGGGLLLGKSEGVIGMEELFEPVSKPDRIYRLKRSNRAAAGGFPVYVAGRPAGDVDAARLVAGAAPPRAGLEAVLEYFGAGIVLVERGGRILSFHGPTEKYLGHPKGIASFNVLDMTTAALSARLRRAINKALQRSEPVHLAQVSLPQAKSKLANLTVMRVNDAAGEQVAVIFEDARRSSQPAPVEEEPLVGQLEHEINNLRGELRSNADEYTTAAEELKAANEEVLSMNEELQSANEELEASKEELQSVNEELITVNSQLNDKVDELTKANDDLANLLGATEIATVFLDAHLLIRRFTPQATALLNLIDSDLGRPIEHITQNFAGVDLSVNAGNVLKNLSPIESEVRARDGRWYTVRILPYRTLDNRIDGTVISFSDVTRLKQTEIQLRYEKTYAEEIFETVRHPALVLSADLQVQSANLAFYETFQIDPEHTIGRKVYELGGRQWNIPRLRRRLEEIIPKESAFQDFRVEHVFEGVGRKVMLASGRWIRPISDLPVRVLLTIEDITAPEKDRHELQALNRDLERRVAERTAMVERRSEQLRQVAVELTRSEQRERERLASVLHDNLQQLLVGAKFQLNLVRSHAKSEQPQRAIDLVEDLIDRSLDASRSLTVELSPPILSEAGLGAALEVLGRQMERQHNLKVETKINAAVQRDDGVVAILLYSAVRELLLNVAKHANVDSARVQLDRSDGDVVRILVSDEGTGFDWAKHQAGATGMGLIGLQQRLEQLGGLCVIDTAPGRGTRVTLIAKVDQPPRRAANTEEAADPQESPLAVTPDPGEASGRIRVLLVDDHAIVRRGLAGILNAEPDIVTVAEASDGQEAIQQARIQRPDVIIMDLSMPGMNGIDATKAIVAEMPGTMIVGLSMNDDDDRIDAIRQAGAVGYVRKGGHPDDLLAAIRAAAGRRAGPER